MKGDFSRDTFSPRKHYSAVLMQQGRVQLDADWNEQQAIIQQRTEAEARALIGPSGGPADNAGFEITARGDTLGIGKGYYFVDGILCQNEDDVLFRDQNDLPGQNVMDVLAPRGRANGVGLVYLDVWEQHVTALEDDHIRETALGGPDTATRKRTVWQTRVLPIEADTTSNLAELQERVLEHRARASELAQATDDTEVYRLRTELRRVDDRILELLKVDRSGSFDDELRAAYPASTGKLLADTDGDSNNGATRLLPPGTGFGRLENQLYRIEIHEGGGPGVATFKWSRDNGSVVTPVLRIPYAETDTSTDTEIAVRDLGNDETLGFAPGQYVELISEDKELSGQVGTLRRISRVDPAKRTITVEGSIDEVTPEDARHFHYKLRRWDSAGALKVPLNDGPVMVEGGIQVRFSTETDGDRYNAGDYWLIPARTGTGDIEWPENEYRPPAGVEHHYSPLALVMLATVATEDGGGEKHLQVLSDLRGVFSPLTGMTGLFYLGGDGQSALPLRELPEPLVVGVAAGGRPVQGARVEFAVQGEDLAAYDGRLALQSGAATTNGGSVKRLTATTDARGEAKCFWTLAKNIPNQRVKVSLADGSHLPVYFNATLSTSQTVSESIQIEKIALGEQELQLNSEIPATALADSQIRVVCREVIGEAIIKRRPPCNLTLDVPFPQSAPDKQFWGDATIGFQPLILAGDVSAQGSVISWKPKKETGDWLKNTLFVKVPSTQLMAHFTIKGEFTFPSAGFGRSDDFEMWFRIVKDPVRLNSVTLDRNGVTGQSGTVTGTVNLVGPAPAGGTTINLESNNANVASVEPATVTIVAGQTSQTFKVNTRAVATDTPVTITAAIEQQRRSANLVVQAPVLEGFTVSPTSLLGKATAQGTVTLTGPAPTGGVSVALQSGNPTIVRVPQAVNVPAGNRTNTTPFTIETEPVGSVTPVAITASFIGSRQVTLTMQPPVLNSLTLNASSVTGGTSQISGRVNLNAPAPAGYSVALRSTDTAAATVPESVLVPPNATGQDFSVTTKPVATRTDLSIVATRGGLERPASLSIQPPTLTNFVFSPARIPNAGSSTGTITLSGPAPSNTVANLAATNDATATVPTSIPVTAGATQITFEASGRAFTDPERSVTINCFYLGATRSATLTVEGRIVPGSVTVSPSTVIGRTASVQGTVTLTGPAPAGGLSVALSSANPAVARVPQSVNVPAGSTSAQFSISTEPVSGSTPVAITASSQNVQQTTTLTVQPPTPVDFTFSPSQIGGGANSTATISLSGPAPGGTSVTLSRSNTTAADFTTSITVPINATQVTFNATGKVFTGANQSVTVTASYLGGSRSATLTVLAKAKDTKEKEKDLKDTKEKERFEEKEFEKLRDDRPVQPFAERPRGEETGPAPEEAGSERSFIQPEERPDLDGQTTDESEEE